MNADAVVLEGNRSTHGLLCDILFYTTWNISHPQVHPAYRRELPYVKISYQPIYSIEPISCAEEERGRLASSPVRPTQEWRCGHRWKALWLLDSFNYFSTGFEAGKAS